MNNIPSFLALESANETPVIGSFKLAEETNSFDAVFESARSTIMQEYGLDPMIDINQMIKNKGLMTEYKNLVLAGLMNEHVIDPFDANGVHDDPRFEAVRDQINQMWDNCVEDLVSESARTGALLPFKAVDLPFLVKQHLSMVGKDIMDF